MSPGALDDGHDSTDAEPAAAAADLARAIEILRAAGATDEDFERLPPIELAGELSVRPAGRRISWDELVTASGLDDAEARAVVEACGLPAGAAHTWYSSDVDILRASAIAGPVLGRAAILGLMRRTGTAASLLATASSGAFRVSSVSGPLSGAVSVSEFVERNLAPQVLVQGFVRALEQVLRHHYLISFRDNTSPAGDHGELRELCIGFVDLTASTALGVRSTADELSAAMTDFEAACTRVAVRRGARVVKTIGDEVMLCAPEPSAVCGAAVDLVAELAGHSAFDNARGGVAFGNVLEQDGDCFGPVVNCAARLVEAAPDGTVMATAGVADRLTPPLRWEARPSRTHRGLGVVPWGRILLDR